MKKIILLIIIALFLSSCSSNVEEVNDVDYTIILERSGMFTLPEFARQIYTINESKIKLEVYSYNGSKTGESSYNFSKDEFENIINFVNLDSFWNLRELHESEVPIADVGYGIVTVKTQNAQKTIKIDPYISTGNSEEISKLIEIIYNLTSKVEFPIVQIEEEPNPEIVLIYQPVQCREDVWDKWYSSGEINYIRAPSESELIQDYYANLEYQIEVEEFISDLATCEACFVCASGNYFEGKLIEGDPDDFIADGWTYK